MSKIANLRSGLRLIPTRRSWSARSIANQIGRHPFTRKPQHLPPRGFGTSPISPPCKTSPSPMKVFFFSTHTYDRDTFSTVSKPDNFHFTFEPSSLSPLNASIAEGHDAVCIFVNDECNAEVLRILHHHGVRAVLLRCAGYNNVDTQVAKELGIFVARVPAYSPEAIAEHTIALIMTLNRKTHRAFNRIRENNFSLQGLLGFTLYGKTAGIIGTGKIGLCTAKILKGFGMKVLAYDVYHNPEFIAIGGEYISTLEGLLPQCHIVSLHAPLLETTKNMINADTIQLMRPGALLVNTSRGALVHHQAIIEALKKKHLGGLAIDVYEAEEGLFFKNHEGEILEDEIIARLMTFHNVLITGHQGFFTRESLSEIASVTVNNLRCFEEGKSECPNTV